MKNLPNHSIIQRPIPFLFLLVFLSFCHFSTLQAQSNEGTEFWFGFLEHVDNNTNNKVAMITSKQNTSGTISIPLRGWSQNFSVSANSVTLVNLPTFAEVIGSESIEDQGVLLTSQLPISVYIHQYSGFRSEASTVLPTSSIGNTYYAMSYIGYANQGGTYPSEFLIIAMTDETEIDITVSAETAQGKAAGTTFSIALNRGEVYQVQAEKAGGDLTGSFINGNKNFAVFSGNQWTQVPSSCGPRDNLMEQMYAVSTWGKQFVTVPSVDVAFDVFRILAAEDNTQVEVHGTTNNSYTLNAGKFQEYQKSEATYITADKPILICQYNVGSSCSGNDIGDPSMVLLNSIEQTRDTVTLYNSAFENITENFINIIVASSDLASILLDGQPLSSNTATGKVGLNDEFTYIQARVSSGAHTITAGGCGVSATVYGYGNLESYAYGGGASFSNINANPIPEGGCLNDTLFFDTGLPESKYNFFWDFGGGDVTTEKSFQRIYNDLGAYPVQLIIHDICLDTRDTSNRNLQITLRQEVEVIEDIQVCEGTSIELGAIDLTGAKYEWTGPNDYFDEVQFPTIHNTIPNMTGQYHVIGIVSGCATFPASIEVEIVGNPQPTLVANSVYCAKTEPINLHPGEFTSYLWQNGATTPSLPLIEEGTYTVEVRNDFGCIGSISKDFQEQCPTRVIVPAAFSPNEDGINDTFGIEGDDLISIEFSIYNRWGEQLFRSNDPTERWDGYDDFRVLPQGVYVWQLVFEGFAEDGSVYSEVRSGTVTLLR